MFRMACRAQVLGLRECCGALLHWVFMRLFAGRIVRLSAAVQSAAGRWCCMGQCCLCPGCTAVQGLCKRYICRQYQTEVPSSASKPPCFSAEEWEAHIWGGLGTGLCKGLDDAGVDVEEVVTGHARFPGHACWDDHQLGACDGILQVLLASVALDLWQHAPYEPLMRLQSSQTLSHAESSLTMRLLHCSPASWYCSG